MRIAFLLLLASLAACDDRAGACGTPDITDPDDRIGVDVLRATYDEWTSWAGADRVCVETITVAETDDDAHALTTGAWMSLVVDPDAEDPARELRAGLCHALDEREGLLDANPDPYSRWGSRQQMFLAVCSDGPQPWDLVDPTEAACGASLALAEQRFLLETVYPAAPAGHPEPLVVTAGGVVLLDEADGTVKEVTGLGDRLVVVRAATSDTGVTYTAALLDPDTGASVTVATQSATTFSSALFTGPEAAVLLLDDQTATTAWVLSPDGSAVALAVDPASTWQGAVGGGTLYRSGMFPTALQTVDLATGVAGTIPLPVAPDDIVLDSLVGVPGGVVATYTEATVDVDGDSVSIGVSDPVIARYDAATATWNELARGLAARGVGLDADGRLVGAFAAWSPLSPSGSVVGAFDLASGTLFASPDLCASEEGPPRTVTGDRAWWAGRDDTGPYLTPHVLDAD